MPPCCSHGVAQFVSTTGAFCLPTPADKSYGRPPFSPRWRRPTHSGQGQSVDLTRSETDPKHEHLPPWPEVGYSGAPPNAISFPSGSRYVILRTPLE